MKGNDASTTYRGCPAAYHGDGSGLVNRNEVADRCVEDGHSGKCIVGYCYQAVHGKAGIIGALPLPDRKSSS
jgi:hypothetical protein